MTGDHTAMTWRTGRKVGRTIYAQAGSFASDDDVLIGMMDTPELASAAVAAHNASLGAVFTADLRSTLDRLARQQQDLADAVLALASEFDTEDGTTPEDAQIIGRPVSRGDRIREAIARELLGKEGSDGK